MSALTPEDLRIFEASMDIQNGGVSLFTEYYFGVELMPHQVLTAHATQTSVLTLGGRGSGKTFGWIFTYLWLATLMPDSRILWTSYTADQAAIAFYEVAMPYIAQSERFQKFLPEGMKSLKKKPYPQINLQIPGTNLPLSWIIFQPVDAHGSGDTKRGKTLDCIHIDEGGLIHDYGVIKTLRPSMRGNRNVVGNPPRLCRMSVSTTPTSAEWLRDWYLCANDESYPGYAPDKYLAVRVRSSENTKLDPAQIEAFGQDMTAEERQVELDADFPEALGNEFSPAIVNLCQDNRLNQELEELVRTQTPGAEHRVAGKVGTILYQKPVSEHHHYILAGDPGIGSPPYRNAPCVMVFDVTHSPYELVYFCWVNGNGSYKPFFQRYTWAYDYYRPIFSVLDATGTQKAMDELYLEAQNVHVEGLSITTEKPAMINAARILMQKGLLRLPYIQGLRLQLLNYRQDEDRSLAQDIVMTLVMACWKMRLLYYQEASEIGGGEEMVQDVYSRNVRDAHRTTGRRV